MSPWGTNIVLPGPFSAAPVSSLPSVVYSLNLKPAAWPSRTGATGSLSGSEVTMDRTRSVVTGERVAQGMTFDEYVRYTATPENLAREAGWWLGRERKDLSGILRPRDAEAPGGRT